MPKILTISDSMMEEVIAPIISGEEVEVVTPLVIARAVTGASLIPCKN
jgi:hypothetical protein